MADFFWWDFTAWQLQTKFVDLNHIYIFKVFPEPNCVDDIFSKLPTMGKIPKECWRKILADSLVQWVLIYLNKEEKVQGITKIKDKSNFANTHPNIKSANSTDRYSRSILNDHTTHLSFAGTLFFSQYQDDTGLGFTYLDSFLLKMI